jgi:hypothetical protein
MPDPTRILKPGRFNSTYLAMDLSNNMADEGLLPERWDDMDTYERQGIVAAVERVPNSYLTEGILG